MKYLFISALCLATATFCYGGPLRLYKRATFYVANETACVVDGEVYSMNEPIPTDNPCETCRCRPPGFACVLANCPAIRPGCREDPEFYNLRRAVASQRDVGQKVERQCCPKVICDGCVHNGKTYRDGEKISNSQQPCLTCHCLGTSTVCSTETCPSRVNCAAEYVAGECCPRYTNCSSVDSVTKVATNSGTPTSVPILPDVDRASSEVVNTEVSNNQEKPEINNDSDTLEHVSETQERGNSATSQTSDDIETTPKSIQNTDSAENGSSETNKESELLNTDSEAINEENIEKSERPVDGDSPESPTDSDGLVPVETDVPKGNTEISPDETAEEHKLDKTTVAQDQPSNDLITTETPSKLEKEIETNTIEKRFRSLENATGDDKSETTQSDDVKTTNAEKTVTQSQEKQSSLQEIETTTHVPGTNSSPEVVESKDTTISQKIPTKSVDNAPEKFLYNAEKKITTPEPLATVTAVVNVHEETIGSKLDDETTPSVFPGEQNLSTDPTIPKESNNSEFVNEAASTIPN